MGPHPAPAASPPLQPPRAAPSKVDEVLNARSQKALREAANRGINLEHWTCNPSGAKKGNRAWYFSKGKRFSFFTEEESKLARALMSLPSVPWDFINTLTR
jgi:hypothetical protein